ncbi:MAG: DUF177 domain-containing protein [Ignavibacteria bacterium]|nr:DUF177 domain-containing protein [Ignavibacteria bacterium]
MDTSNSRDTSILIPVSRSTDDKIKIDIVVKAKQIPFLAPEISGDIRVYGKATSSRSNVRLRLTVEASAELICDRSLEEFVEPLTAHLDLEYRIDNHLAAEQRQASIPPDTDEVRGIREDESTIDITDDVRQELALLIPMRRVSPKYRDVDLSEINPSYSGRTLNDSIDDTAQDQWAVLKALRNL